MYPKDCGTCEYLKRIMPTENHGAFFCDDVMAPLEQVEWCGIPSLDKEISSKYCTCVASEGHSAGTLMDGTELIICNICGYKMSTNKVSLWDA